MMPTAAWALALFAAAAAFGQPAFEVASIRPNISGDGHNVTGGTNIARNEDGVKLEVRNTSLLTCLQRAYGVKAYQISGPDWLDSARFDIAARSSMPVSKDQVLIMWQALLEDRFQLKLHRETVVRPVYALVVAKNGPKIHPAEVEGTSGTWEGKAQLTAKKESMAHFAEVLSRRMDRAVIDETGLAGVFDFVLDLLRDDSHATPEPNFGGAIFTALQDQLGLRLEAKKQPIEILVIDHIEKLPTGN
jgi:uncharacterized protein (TIGR03435 family)